MDQNTVALLPEVKEFLAKEHYHYIDGYDSPSTGGERISIVNPATEEVIATTASGTLADMEKAVKVAHRTFKNEVWSGMRPAERERILMHFADLLHEQGEILAQLETLNQGKSIHIARSVEVGATSEYMRYMAGWTTKITGQTMPISIAVPEGLKHTAYTFRQPVGVVAAISPWNFPLSIAVWKVFPALVAGCSVVLKPARETPLTALYLAKLASEAGIPDGVFNVITGSGSVIGQALAEHPLVRKITFTGSTEVGKKVGHAAVDHMAHFSLELGGKNPMVLFDDVPVAKAIEGIMMGAFLNSGQVCAAASRIFVQKDLYKVLLPQLVDVLKGLKMGSGLELDAQIQPVTSKSQQKSILSYIEKARVEGATILCGGKAPDRSGFFVEPTIIIDMAKGSTILCEEVFGPVIAVIPFEDEDDLLEEVNNTRYGLASSIWTNDLGRVMRLLPKIEAGTVWVNTHVPLDPALPFGGLKESGVGREFGQASVESFTEVKSVCLAY